MEIAISRQQNSAPLALLMEMRAIPLARALISHHGFVFSNYTALLKRFVFCTYSQRNVVSPLFSCVVMTVTYGKHCKGVFWVVCIVYTQVNLYMVGSKSSRCAGDPRCSVLFHPALSHWTISDLPAPPIVSD